MKNKEQPYTEHLRELRNRLMFIVLSFSICFILSYFFSSKIYEFLTHPLANNLGKTHRLIYTGLTEMFFTYLKLSFYCAIYISFPIIAFHIYRFLCPGLKKDERRFLLPLLFISPILFLAGLIIVYYFIFPLAWPFFISFEMPNSTLPIQLEAKVSEYLSLVLQLMFAFGLAFQLPIIILLLVKLGALSISTLSKCRKYAIVVIFIFAAILTPPDVISQIGLALPLLLLYELSIIACKILIKDKTNA